MLKKFLATVSVVGLIAGGASALEVVPQVDAADSAVPAGQPIVLAAELDYDGDSVVTTGGVAPLAAGQGRLTFSFHPTGVGAGASFPTGNVLLRVTVDGARFRSALTGAEVTSGGTSVISEGGARNASDVTFLLSDVSTCVVGSCTVNLPLILEGGNVAVNVGLETDAGAPIDNTSLTSLKRAVLAVEAPAFDVRIFAEQDLEPGSPLSSLPAVCGPAFGGFGNPTNATLASEYTALSDDFGPGAVLGYVTAVPRIVPFASALSPCATTDVVRRSIGGTPVGPADVSDIIVSIEGTMDAFEDGDFQVAGISGAPDADDDTAAVDGLGLATAMSVVADPDGVTVITRSSYDVTVEVAVAASSSLTRGVTVSGEVDPIGREGTQVTFPWTQSATQAEASGASSVFRIGNLTTSDTGAVYAEILNSSAAGFTSGGLIELTDAIEANGEFVINSAQLEAAVGDYGRGDVNFIVEAESDELTARQFVVRNGNIQQVIGGTVFQDQN